MLPGPHQSLPLAAAAITLTGLGMPLSSVTLSVWAGDLSAPEDYDRLVKWLSSTYMLGSLVTGPVPGLLADRFGGSYVPAYGLFLLFLLVSMLLIQTVYRRTGAAGPSTERSARPAPRARAPYSLQPPWRTISPGRWMPPAALRIHSGSAWGCGWSGRCIPAGPGRPRPSLPMIPRTGPDWPAPGRRYLPAERWRTTTGRTAPAGRTTPPAGLPHGGRRKQAPWRPAPSWAHRGSAQFTSRRPSAPRASAVRQMVPHISWVLHAVQHQIPAASSRSGGRSPAGGPETGRPVGVFMGEMVSITSGHLDGPDTLGQLRERLSLRHRPRWSEGPSSSAPPPAATPSPGTPPASRRSPALPEDSFLIFIKVDSSCW